MDIWCDLKGFQMSGIRFTLSNGLRSPYFVTEKMEKSVFDVLRFDQEAEIGAIYALVRKNWIYGLKFLDRERRVLARWQKSEDEDKTWVRIQVPEGH